MISEEKPFRSLSREERKARIIWAAKRAFAEKGFDEASMEDVAAFAGTTKPTVYAHFKSREELVAAMFDLIRRMFHQMLQSPDAYSDEPLEAIAQFCGRFEELSCRREAIVNQRFILASANRSPQISRSFYEVLCAEAARSLAAYIGKNCNSAAPDSDAELLLSTTIGWQVIRRLYGADPFPEEADPKADLTRIREAVHLIAAKWRS